MRNAYKITVGKLKGRDHLRDRSRWEDNIKVNLTGYESADLIHLAHNRDK
jgi:hypothetical protein